MVTSRHHRSVKLIKRETDNYIFKKITEFYMLTLDHTAKIFRADNIQFNIFFNVTHTHAHTH